MFAAERTRKIKEILLPFKNYCRFFFFTMFPKKDFRNAKKRKGKQEQNRKERENRKKGEREEKGKRGKRKERKGK